MVSPRARRDRLETAVGFVGFFAVLSIFWAVVNALSAEPRVFPALVCLGCVLLFVLVWKRFRAS